ARIANLSVPFFVAAGIPMAPDAQGIEFLATGAAMATSSVDRLNQIPGRLSLLFDYDAEAALAAPGVREEMGTGGARAVCAALAEELAKAPRPGPEELRAVGTQR